MKNVHLGGCWSARGHPEPLGEEGALELRDNEIFLMVPCDAEDAFFSEKNCQFWGHFLFVFESLLLFLYQPGGRPRCIFTIHPCTEHFV